MRIGIDLGGTKTELIVLNEAQEVLVRRRIPTQRKVYSDILDTIVSLVKGAEQEFNIKGTVGVGIPGTIDAHSQVVKNANLTLLNGQPLGLDLEKALNRDVRVANDANCFALSEATDGAAAGAEVVFGVIAGTGCGGGIVINGRILNGRNGLGGEWGHNRLNDPQPEELPGPDCYCGKKGCLETWISGTGFSASYERQSGQKKTGNEIVALAQEGDPVAKACLEGLASRMARGLSQIINILDPDVIVLGGGVSNIDPLYTMVPKLWGQWVFSKEPVQTLLKKNVHGDSSGVRGAAWLWPASNTQ